MTINHVSPPPDHRLNTLAKSISFCFFLCCPLAWAAEESVEYDSSFLMGSAASSLDLSRYSNGNATLPGRYDITIFVNDKPVASQNVEFIETEKNRGAQACITQKTLLQIHVAQPDRDGREGVLLQRDSTAEDCLDLMKLIPQSNVRYDESEQRLNVEVPQASLIKGFQNYVDPSLWDEGVNAVMLSYNANAWHSESDGANSDSLYAGLYGGINLASWHFRSRGNYNWQKDGAQTFDFQNIYVQRDVAPLRSQLQFGEAFTTGETFDSVQIQGVRLYSDSRMLPPSLSSFSPTIHGVANSNAKITIMQGGYKIYETTVPPGPFAIDDINPSGFGSDLEVTVEEADGSTHSFTQPFSSVVQMLHPGVGSWDLSVGQVNKDDLYEKPGLAQGTLYYGLNNTFTGYTGVQATDNGYLAALLGLGINTGIGAFSFDVTHSSTRIPDDKAYQGQSYRVSWNKFFDATNTSLNIAAYRYSTQDYLGLNDALTLIDDANHPAENSDDDNTMKNFGRMKNQFSVSLNQSLQRGDANYGSFYLTGSWTDYWVTQGSQSNFSLGYSNGASWGSYSISVQRTWDEYNRRDDSVYLGIAIPLENFWHRERKRSGFRDINMSVTSNLKGREQYNASSSGASENGQWYYGVNTGYSTDNAGPSIRSIGGNLGYESPWGTLSGYAYTSDDGNRQYSLNTDGGFVLHRGGLTFSNDSFSDTDTLVLVNAPGAKGARINYGNSTVDRWGYGVANALAPYHENTISLGIDDVENDVELKSTSTMAVPRYGSVILSRFETDEGRSAMFTVKRDDNQPVPFAADVYDEEGKSLGSVGQGGQAWIRGIEDSGTLEVRWAAEGAIRRCQLSYQVPNTPKMLDKTLLLDVMPCQMQAN